LDRSRPGMSLDSASNPHLRHDKLGRLMNARSSSLTCTGRVASKLE
jgi:hypothetical protein